MFFPPWPFWAFVAIMIVVGLYVSKQNKRDDTLRDVAHMDLLEVIELLKTPSLQQNDYELWCAGVRRGVPLYQMEKDRDTQHEFEMLIGHTIESIAVHVIETSLREQMAEVRQLKAV